MTHTIERKKWILYRHTNSFDMITQVAINLKYFSKSSISNIDKLKLLEKLKELDYFKERNPELPLDSINHRINTLAYYMFGYKTKIAGQDKFLFSPLGNLFLKHIGNKENISKIFFTMLWAIQFKHPHGGSDKMFNLYPFRLLFQLLTDDRLNFKLYAFEIAYLVVFIENIDKKSYEVLISEILKMRKLTDKEIEVAFKKDEHTYVNSIYEWDYYVSEFLSSAGILEKKVGEVVCKLKHGTNTYRKVTRNEVTLSTQIFDYCIKLKRIYSYDNTPLKLDDSERLRIDIVKEIYNFYPKLLLQQIGEEISDIKIELLNLTKLIETYANNNEGEQAYLFEDILVHGFNQFYNVEAKKIGGAGETDLECLYLTKRKKFAVDAKSTKNKLSGLNSGRLAAHREKIGGAYTIVITPRYVPAVLQDIKSFPIVIIRASTFAEYLYNCIDNGIRKIDYGDFDEIIINNLGSDVSNKVSNLTIENFAVSN